MKRHIKRAVKTLRARLSKQREKTSFRHQGDQARARGDWVSASALYRKHVQAQPTDFDIWVQLGHALKEVGRYDEAETAYVAAGALRSRDPDLWLMRGHLARLRGDEQSAARHYAVSAGIDHNPRAVAERDRSRAAVRAAEPGRYQSAAPQDSRQVGAVQPIIDGWLRGWAVDPDHPDQPAIIELLLDGEPFDTIVAQGASRSEVLGGRAFELEVSGRLDLSQSRCMEARLARTKETLEGSPLEVGVDRALKAWRARFDYLEADDAGRLRARVALEAADTVLEVLAYQTTGIEKVRALIRRMDNQMTPAWRLHLVDQESDEDLSKVLTDAALRDQRITITKTTPGASPADNLRRLIEAAKGPWVTPLPEGWLPEPEMVFRIVDATRQRVDLILADVAFYGCNTDSLEGFSAEPAWSSSIIDPDIRSRRLCAFPRDAIAAIELYQNPSWPLVSLVEVVGAQAAAVAQIPALLARAPASRRAPSGPFPAPSVDDNPIVVVVEAPEKLGVLSKILDVVHAEIGPAGRVLLVDPHPRGKAADLQLKRLSERLERTSCHPITITRTLDMVIRTAFTASCFVILAPSIVPARGAIRRLVSRQSATGAAVVAGALVDNDRRYEGLGYLAGPNGAISPAWSHRQAHEIAAASLRPHACTAAGLDMAAISLAAFKGVGGFDPELTGMWRDIDVCLRLRQAGFSVLVEPQAEAVRHGLPPVQQAPQDRVVRRRWTQRLSQDDPFYSPLYSSALDYMPGTMDDPWLAMRVSIQPSGVLAAKTYAPLTPPPYEFRA